jgi:Tfp pilus assembly protein PilF
MPKTEDKKPSHSTSSDLKYWKIVGLLATLFIILSIPAYWLKITHFNNSIEAHPLHASFAGSRACMDCHKAEYEKWEGSHHQLAMAVATDKAVLGDFNAASFDYFGVSSRFYRKNGKFFVHTQGPEGKMDDFEITHTFGVYPLQQYLVPFSGGRLQCLPIAWDARENRWFHLNPDKPISPDDWLYWTNAGQNWNGMCAECHSTNLKKGYDLSKDSYETTWSDINVGCEACHGPGSHHVEWAELPDMARPEVENFALLVNASGISSRDLVELCAPCHSRRASLGDYTHDEKDLLDSLLPSLLEEHLYFPDGQILEEVYVYGSFIQSKMYHRDVKCSDCHDVHSLKLVKEGNDLCLQCHRADIYDSKSHHFHKNTGEKGEPIKSPDGTVLFEVGSGAQCVQCHMPGRNYMIIDYRPDHSFRLPRPDLSIQVGVPNACNRCHVDKTVAWADEHMTKWYGPGRRPHYGTTIAAGQNRIKESRDALIELAKDPLYPVNARATATALLAGYDGEESQTIFEMLLADEEALIRRTAVDHLSLTDPKRQVELLVDMLYDPVLGVRIEAARKLVEMPSKQLDKDQIKTFQAVLAEYRNAMEYAGDFSSGRHNLANMYAGLGKDSLAVENYKAAYNIDDQFYPAKVNLAMLYNKKGKQDEAESLLKEVVEKHPQLYEIQYSLGLLLAEQKNYTEAAAYLQAASEGLPQRSRILYNLGLLLSYLKKTSEAESALKKALALEPENLEYLYALADFYIKTNAVDSARQIVQNMIKIHPDKKIGYDILKIIDSL